MVKNNNKSGLSKTLLAMVVIGAAFVYGIVVGKYHVFPYGQLQAAKAIIAHTIGDVPPESVPDRQLVNYRNRIGIHSIYDDTADIVMIGDSITDYVEWSELFPGVSISNRGISGDTTDGVLQRIDTVIATGAKVAFIMIGVNDFTENISVDVAFANYEKIIDRLLANGVRPYIQSTILGGDRRKNENMRIMALNDRLRELAVKEGITFIDLNSRLSANGILDDRFTSDSIHLNAEGYRVWKELIDPVMDDEKMSHAGAKSTLAEVKKNR